jgi:hypothetical protein
VEVKAPSGEFGTNIGVHVVVKTSSSSPEVHVARGVTWAGWVARVMAGTAATARANPPARISRRIEFG